MIHATSPSFGTLHLFPSDRLVPPRWIQQYEIILIIQIHLPLHVSHIVAIEHTFLWEYVFLIVGLGYNGVVRIVGSVQTLISQTVGVSIKFLRRQACRFVIVRDYIVPGEEALRPRGGHDGVERFLDSIDLSQENHHRWAYTNQSAILDTCNIRFARYNIDLLRPDSFAAIIANASSSSCRVTRYDPRQFAPPDFLSSIAN